ncbi:MAG: type II/IV secretion system protein [Armatimonadetes bacterium]|nr:type II/IV secretion system protein [Armatimonadota bacterium]
MQEWGQPGDLRAPDNILVLDSGQSTVAVDAPVVLLLNELILEAIQQRVSDMHIEPHEREVLIRFRIDGILIDWRSLSTDNHAPLTSRVKVLSNIDIAERRLPMDGRFTIQVRGARWDVRVSTIPGIFGEKTVLRLLPKEATGLALSDLGMLERDRQRYEAFIAKPFGMVLATGPTGSGKTTTLYASLRQLDCVGKNVITIEDPVEYELRRVTQMQVHPKIGLTFATGLRHILRQDPDIIMVGEIRDTETLAMAVQAALTGHLVFSTLHCNDAASAAARALDMGLEPYLFTSSVISIVAQRLVRRVCPHCKVLEPLPAAVRRRFEVTDPRAGCYRGRGCSQCRQTGYHGRVGVFEMMSLTDAIKQAIHERRTATEIRQIAIREGCGVLRDDAIRKVQMGLTTPEEVLRAVWLTDEA